MDVHRNAGPSVLIQYATGDEHTQMLDATRDIHRRYCERFGIDYYVEVDGEPDRRSAFCRKIGLLREMLAKGYHKAVWLDSDGIIVDDSYNICDAAGFGVAACECFDSPSIHRHINTGFLLCTAHPQVNEFLKAWDEHPIIDPVWPDQTTFIALMAQRPYRDILTILPNRFNCLEQHMEAHPVIRAFHGDPQRLARILEWARRVTGKELPVSAPLCAT
ncbi:MAG: hypothetical protein JWN71_3032 [Xanthobacteraceae bacterium]|nr:hypothetical protein [Xanthobacteraceae bacterium]